MPAVARRSYRQFCGLARALDVIGERWTMLILRNLLLGPRRYSDLLEELPGITTNLLAKRLKDLETEGLIQKVMLSRTTAYALSEAGAALEPALMELAKWGGRYLERPHPDDRFDIGWALLSMKRRYRGGKELRVALHVGERVFDIQVQPSYVGVRNRRTSSSAARSTQCFISCSRIRTPTSCWKVAPFSSKARAARSRPSWPHSRPRRRRQRSKAIRTSADVSSRSCRSAAEPRDSPMSSLDECPTADDSRPTHRSAPASAADVPLGSAHRLRAAGHDAIFRALAARVARRSVGARGCRRQRRQRVVGAGRALPELPKPHGRQMARGCA